MPTAAGLPAWVDDGAASINVDPLVVAACVEVLASALIVEVVAVAVAAAENDVESVEFRNRLRRRRTTTGG